MSQEREHEFDARLAKIDDNDMWERLVAMSQDHESQSWDFSDNDLLTLTWAVKKIRDLDASKK